MRENRDTGFTLIELMVCVLLVAIALAIAIPFYVGWRDGDQPEPDSGVTPTSVAELPDALPELVQVCFQTDEGTVRAYVPRGREPEASLPMEMCR